MQKSLNHLKVNASAKVGDKLFLTKPLGVGIFSTAQKRGHVQDYHINTAIESMSSLNKIGARLAEIPGVNAMTDVTGFGLMGHLLEMCEGSNASAVVDFESVPTFDREALKDYHQKGCVPGGARRNFASYGENLDLPEGFKRDLLCDPQTSGGLLVSVEVGSVEEVVKLLSDSGLPSEIIGEIVPNTSPTISI